MMKKIYASPLADIIDFKATDIITVSGEDRPGLEQADSNQPYSGDLNWVFPV